MIDLKDVSKAYPNGVHALNHVNLHIDKGEFVYVIGATGSGKSTLIKVLNGEIVPDEGTVIVGGSHSDLVALAFDLGLPLPLN